MRIKSYEQKKEHRSNYMDETGVASRLEHAKIEKKGLILDGDKLRSD